jgi:hypothetical protein
MERVMKADDGRSHRHSRAGCPRGCADASVLLDERCADEHKCKRAISVRASGGVIEAVERRFVEIFIVWLRGDARFVTNADQPAGAPLATDSRCECERI